MKRSFSLLALDSSEWNNLEHAYGNASDIPDLLRALAVDTSSKSGHEAEPWFTLWSSLCHQSDAYAASFAAVPHIVNICLDADGPVAMDFFLLPACIEIARATGRAPAIEGELLSSYERALPMLRECAVSQLAFPMDEDMAVGIAVAIAVANGHTQLAAALVNLDEDIITRLAQGNFPE